MEREKLLKIILGERYDEGKDIANIVLDYVNKNPYLSISMMSQPPSHNEVLEAISNALNEIYGYPLEHYLERTRRRDIVYVRQMAIYLYMEATNATLCDTGEIFRLHYSTVIHTLDLVKNLLKVDKPFYRDFVVLLNTFKNYLYEKD